MKVLVVGGGPAGLMCACKASEKHDVILVDKNEKVGKKIYITGKGRCNVTNNCLPNEFVNNVVTNNKFLYSSINCFTPQDAMRFFALIYFLRNKLIILTINKENMNLRL